MGLRVRFGPVFGIVATAVAAMPAPAGATVIFTAVGGDVDEGDTIDVRVFVENTATGVQGWQYGLCHDPARLTYLSSEPGADTGPGGIVNAEFMDLVPHPSPPPGPAGVAWAVVLDFAPPFTGQTLPAGVFEDLKVTYRAAMLGPGDADPTATEVVPCHQALGDPPVSAVYTAGGMSFAASLAAGEVRIHRVPGPPPYFNVRVEDETVGQGETVEVSVFIDTNVSGVQGWQYGLCHDTARLSPIDRALGAATAALNGDAGPDFTDFDAYAGGESWALIVDLESIETLPPGGGLEDLVVTYQAAPGPVEPSPTLVPITPCHQMLGEPPVAAMYTVGGYSFPAGLIPGTVAITGPPPYFDVRVEGGAVDEGATAAVSIFIDTNVPGVQGWQYGLCHDTVLLSPVGYDLGAATGALAGGAGPDFTDFDTYAGGETWALIVDLESVEKLPPGDGQEDLVVTYQATLLEPADPDPVVDTIAPCDGVLGDPPVAAVYTVGGLSRLAGRIAGDVEIHKAPNPFIRGDGNGDAVLDLADPIWILNYLFRGGPSGDCLLALDGNGDATIDIGDAMYVLNYLFTGGPLPPAPFPACGTVPGQTLSQCTANACP